MNNADAVIEILENEIGLYASLADAIEEGRRRLARMSVPEIYETTAVQEGLTLRIKGLEDARTCAVRRLASELGKESATITLKYLVDNLGEPYHARFMELSVRLAVVLSRVEDARNASVEIINRELTHLDQALYLLGGGGLGASEGYGLRGEGGKAKATASLLASEL